MDNTFSELDSFTAEMLIRTKERENELKKLLNENDEEDILLTKPILSKNVSNDENDPKVDNSTKSECVSASNEDIDEEVDDVDEELLNDDNFKTYVRESMHKLLNIREPIVEQSVLPEKLSTIARLNQRLNRISTFYKDEEPPKVLLEKNSNSESESSEPVYKRSNLKERLHAIAQSYYPTNDEMPAISSKQNQFEELKLNTKSESEIVESPVKKPVELFKYKSVAYEKPARVSNVTRVKENLVKDVPVKSTSVAVEKKTSVADLKKLFETKVAEANSDKKEVPPELLSLREKKRLFEKEIVAQNEARSMQYRKQPPPLKRISDWMTGSKVAEEPESKRPKSGVAEEVELIESEVVNEVEEIEQIDESLEKSSPNIQETSNQCEELESEVVSAQESVVEAFKTIDNLADDSIEELTFSELDNSKLPVQSSNFTVSLSDDNSSNGQIHRSSTKTDLRQQSTDSIPPEKPPRLYESEEKNVEHNEPPPPIDDVPLRTISFYRREQKMKKEAEQCLEYIPEDSSVAGGGTPKVIYLKQRIASEDNNQGMDFTEFKESCQKKIESLQMEISEHNRIALQAKQALDMSLMLPELQCSSGRVEAERFLLISSERKAACLTEMSRLRSMIKHPENYMNKGSLSKGSVYITNLRVPLRNDFVVARAKGKLTTVHYFICSISHGTQIFVSDFLNAEKCAGTEFLEFNFGLNVTELEDNFTINVKLYSLEISKDHKHSHKTPLLKKSFRKKHIDSQKGSQFAVASPMPKSSQEASPTGTNFKLIGLVALNLSSVQRPPKFYRLDSFSISSPLDGYITMNVFLTVTHNHCTQGFFDMKDVQNTFWNVRWFVVREHQLLYWRFRDDMNMKPPLGVINLKHCINPTVTLLKANQRHLCMRPNTFILVTIEPPAVSNAHKLLNGGTITKPVPEMFFISSQSKSDIIDFCSNINQILRNIRVWESDSVRPYSSDELDRLILNSY